MTDPNNYYHKYHAVQVDFGGEDEFFKGGKITKDIFYGEKSHENAQIFIDSIARSKAIHLKKIHEKELMLNSFSSDSEENSRLSGNKDMSNDSVILDVNPSKFEKSKDHLFFDFFSMYTKNFIDGKAPSKTEAKRRKIIQ